MSSEDDSEGMEGGVDLVEDEDFLFDPIRLSVDAFQVKFHPKEDRVVAISCIDGSLSLHRVRQEDSDDDDESEENEEDEEEESKGDGNAFQQRPLWNVLPMKDFPEARAAGLRGLDFVGENAGHMVCVDSQGLLALLDVERPETPVMVARAWDEGLNVVRTWDENVAVCGTDDGAVFSWDIRVDPAAQKLRPLQQTGKRKRGKKGKKEEETARKAGKLAGGKKAVTASREEEEDQGKLKDDDSRRLWEEMEHGDYISDMYCLKSKMQLLCTSGDASLSVYDMRKGKIFALSQPADSDFMCQ